METFMLFFIHQTTAAILVYETDQEDNFWLPKSQIEYDQTDLDTAERGDSIEINIPEWLAEEEGLL